MLEKLKYLFKWMSRITLEKDEYFTTFYIWYHQDQGVKVEYTDIANSQCWGYKEHRHKVYLKCACMIINIVNFSGSTVNMWRRASSPDSIIYTTFIIGNGITAQLMIVFLNNKNIFKTRYRALHARMSHRTGASKTCLYISDHGK